MIMKIKEHCLSVGETIDKLRVVPRILVMLYIYLVYRLVVWYTAIETKLKTECDAALIKLLMDSGMSVEAASDLACTIVDAVGGPTTAQTTFVTAIIGLSTAIFKFYVETGTNWNKESQDSLKGRSSPKASE